METPPVVHSPYPRPDLMPADGPPCPQCGGRVTRKINYTWWGGVVGPAIFNLMKCESCGCQFNRKTGKPALRAIIIFNLVSWVVAIAITVVIIVLKG